MENKDYQKIYDEANYGQIKEAENLFDALEEHEQAECLEYGRRFVESNLYSDFLSLVGVYGETYPMISTEEFINGNMAVFVDTWDQLEDLRKATGVISESQGIGVYITSRGTYFGKGYELFHNDIKIIDFSQLKLDEFRPAPKEYYSIQNESGTTFGVITTGDGFNDRLKTVLDEYYDSEKSILNEEEEKDFCKNYLYVYELFDEEEIEKIVLIPVAIY